MQRHARSLGLVVLLVLGACGPGQDAAEPTGPTTTASEPSATPTVQDVMELEKFAPLEPGSYSSSTPTRIPTPPLRVVYEVPFEGWSQWFGAVKGVGGWARDDQHHHRR